MTTKTYSPDQVQVIVGSRKLTGFAEDSMISIVRDAETFTKKVGADGEVTRSKTSNRMALATISLMQSSEDNSYLQQLHNTDENTGAGIIPFKVIDKSGSYVALATEAWVEKPADKEFANEAGTRAWQIALAKLDESGGGN